MQSIAAWRAAHGRITYGSDEQAVTLVQKALVLSGASLDIDGEFGPITEQAVKRFQASHWIVPVGWVGTHAATLLDQLLENAVEEPPSTPSVNDKAPWLTQMRAITGTRELPGGADSQIIMSWREDIARAFPDLAPYAATYTGDDIPWCGHVLASCMCRVKPPIRPASQYLLARRWSTNWSAAVKLKKPIVGCVMVFSREGGGHVSLLEKLQGDTCWIRGGNQSDMVNVATRSMDTFIAAMWPTAWPQVTVVGDIGSS